MPSNRELIYGADIDQLVFEQILEMDDDEEDREFSSQIVFDFFDQANMTFERMEEAIKKKEIEELASLGHFLKGSSATLGLIKVRDACEKIQNWGHCMDENEQKISKEDAIARIERILPMVQDHCRDARKRLYQFYRPDGEEEE